MKTTSYKISKQLAEVGFKAENDFFWVRWDTKTKIKLIHKTDTTPYLRDSYVKAYDLETILEALPNFIANKNKGENCLVIDVAFGVIHYEGDSDNETMFITTTEENESLADTAARLLLLLHKKNLIKF